MFISAIRRGLEQFYMSPGCGVSAIQDKVRNTKDQSGYDPLPSARPPHWRAPSTSRSQTSNYRGLSSQLGNAAFSS